MKEQIRKSFTYQDVCGILADYDKFIDMQKAHFSTRVYHPAKDDKDAYFDYVFSPEIYKENKEFCDTWPERQKRIMENLKKGKYTFSKEAGKRRDKDTLLKNTKRYMTISPYFETESNFKKVLNLLGLECSIDEFASELRALKSELDAEKQKTDKKESKSPKTESSKPSQPGDE